MAVKNGIVLIAAPLRDHKLNAFLGILNLPSKMQIRELFNAVCVFCLAKNATSSKGRNKRSRFEYVLQSGRRKTAYFMYKVLLQYGTNKMK